MKFPSVISYEDVLGEVDERRHLLLGNGFSIACRPELFRYEKLFDRARFLKLNLARKAFDLLSTTNFESVIRALENFSVLAGLYAPDDSKAKKRAKDDAIAIKKILVRAVADSHPDRPHDIKPMEYLSCRKFLRGYNSINTLNYDLLLYWTLMQDELQDKEIACDDGFRKPGDNPTADYVSWDPDNSKNQTVRYLHGALHLYDTGSEMKKFTWIDSQIPLIDQIRAALEEGSYPVFVSEGTSNEKVDRIRHNDYLCKMYRAFTELQGSLIVFGHSLDTSDDHIFMDRIGRHGKTSRIYISLLGDPSSKTNKIIIRRATALSQFRKTRKPLDVKFFDAGSVSVWK